MKAEVIVKEAEVQHESIFTQGNLVQHITDSGIIVLVHSVFSSGGDHLFCGTCIKSSYEQTVYYSASWVKNIFKQFKGEVKLKI